MLTRADQLRESRNPLFGPRKLKLGTFSSNLSGGCAISKIDGVLKAEWPSTLALATMADEMEFEALVPVGRWKGFGGKTPAPSGADDPRLAPSGRVVVNVGSVQPHNYNDFMTEMERRAWRAETEGVG